jgi:hypothetical protein
MNPLRKATKPSRETLLLRSLDQLGCEDNSGERGATIRAAAKHIRSLRGKIHQLEYELKQKGLPL